MAGPATFPVEHALRDIPPASVDILDLGTLAYRPAWERQLAVHTEVLSGLRPAGAIILVEHLPVITIGRRSNAQQHLLATPELLAAHGVELVETDRGGDITFHGPGQLVVYPIIPLNYYGLNLHAYMRFLEEIVIQTLAQFGVAAFRDPPPCSATGVWVHLPQITRQDAHANEPPSQAFTIPSAKICALGIKLKRWISLHGIALNVTTDLSHFSLINPCGLSRPVTSLQRLLGSECPPMPAVKSKLADVFRASLAKHLGQARH